MNRSVFLSLFLVCLGACSSQPSQYLNSNSLYQNNGCFTSKESIERKVQLENGIRSQVRFLGEPESFSSINNKMSEYNIPALSFAVIHRGEIEWADVYQNTNYPEATGLNCMSLFQVASLSKPVTFLAAVRMHAAGKLDLDKNIQTYLTDFVLPLGKQTEDNPVTFRNIFSHTSGIASVGYQGYVQGLTVPSDIDILKGSAGVNSPAIAVVAPPNEVLAYSGGGYTLAELALQDIYQAAFPDIMKKWILDPVEMEHSDFTQPLPSSRFEQVAKGHSQSGDVLEGGWRNHPEQAAAGLWSNSIDMAKFLVEIYKAYQGKSTVFSQSDIKSLMGQERDGSVYGFILNRSEDGISITHYGANEGYRSGMTINLETGNGLVFTTNSDNGGLLGNELLLSTAHVYGWQSFKQTKVDRKNVSAEELDELQGEYKWNSQIDISISFDEINNRISLHFPNGDVYPLTPIVGDGLAFIHQNTGIKVTFTKKDGIPSFTLYGQLAVKTKL